MDKQEPLFLPALRATMGDWVYYLSFMNISDIASRISVVEDIHTSQSLKDYLQRSLTDNSKKIATYLLSQEQRFFNAIVVGTYGGSPNWHEISVKGRGKIAEVPGNVEGVMGLLELQGNETLFAIDGQHRIKGIKEAVSKNDALKKEEVCTIFVKGVIADKRAQDPEGYQRTRRLFSTLNRYAKPVQMADIIALDEDDVIAIITRRLLEEHSLLKDKVDMGKSKSIKSTDKTNLTTLVTLYDVMNTVLRNRIRGWRDYKRWRPKESEIEAFYRKACLFWDLLCSQFTSLERLKNSAPEDCFAGSQRGPMGGNLLFRPVGLMMIGHVVADLSSSMEIDFSEAIKTVGRTPTDLAKFPWVGLLWDSTNKRMLTAQENQKIAKHILYNALGGDLGKSPYKTTIEKLKTEFAGILKRDISSVTLPHY